MLEDRRVLSVANGTEPNSDEPIQLFSTSTALFVEHQGQWDNDDGQADGAIASSGVAPQDETPAGPHHTGGTDVDAHQAVGVGEGPGGSAPDTMPDAVLVGDFTEEPAEILDTWIEGNTCPGVCSELLLCITAVSPERGELEEFVWTQVSGPTPLHGPDVVTEYNAFEYINMGATAQCSRLIPDAPGTYVIEVTVYRMKYVTRLGTYVRRTDAPGVTHQFSVSVGAPLDPTPTEVPEIFEVRQGGVTLAQVRPIESIIGSGFSYIDDYYRWHCWLTTAVYCRGETTRSMPYAYNGSNCYPDLLPGTDEDEAMLYLIRPTACSGDRCSEKQAQLIFVLDSTNDYDATGGTAAMHVSGIGTDSYIYLDDDDEGQECTSYYHENDLLIYDPVAGTAEFSWSWEDESFDGFGRLKETDGFGITNIPWTECVTITPDFIEGIDRWTFRRRDLNAPPIELDMSQPVQICPIQCQQIVRPQPAEHPGDFNADGIADQADLDLVLLNWGSSGSPAPAGWISDLPDSTIGQNELDRVKSNWGQTNSASNSLLDFCNLTFQSQLAARFS